MTDRNDQHSSLPAESSSADGSWLADVAQAAGREAGGVPVELLGDYLTLLADAATTGRKPDPAELNAVRLLGRRAAELGVSAGSAVQLYLGAARRLWAELPMVIRARDSAAVRAATEPVLHVVDAAVANLAEGYTEARRQMVRWEETLRREFIEDLLRGDADVGRLVERRPVDHPAQVHSGGGEQRAPERLGEVHLLRRRWRCQRKSAPRVASTCSDTAAIMPNDRHRRWIAACAQFWNPTGVPLPRPQLTYAHMPCGVPELRLGR